jgi:hypothetical protein
MRMLLAIVLAGCACPTPAVKTPATGSGSAAAKPAAPCESVRAHVADLYRAEATAKEPKRVDEAVDNTAMVMAQCAKDEAARVACLQAAQSVADVEQKCVTKLDDEGTEGTSL